jgi:hypothetical protein
VGNAIGGIGDDPVELGDEIPDGCRSADRRTSFDLTNQQAGALTQVCGVTRDLRLATALQLWHPAVERFDEPIQVGEDAVGRRRFFVHGDGRDLS